MREKEKRKKKESRNEMRLLLKTRR